MSNIMHSLAHGGCEVCLMVPSTCTHCSHVHLSAICLVVLCVYVCVHINYNAPALLDQACECMCQCGSSEVRLPRVSASN